MQVKYTLAVLAVIFLLSLLLKPFFAAVGPSPFQPRINQLHSAEFNSGAIDKRIAKLPGTKADPYVITGQLQ
jgi:hypothetical protein